MSVTQVVDPCTGIEFISTVGNKIDIYPNPSDGQLILKLSQDAQAMIVDVFSKVVYDNFLNAGSVSLNMVGIENGVYFIKATMSGRAFVKKIVIRK